MFGWWWWFGSSGFPLTWPLLFHFCLQMGERCYLMKQVLNFTLEEVLFPQSDRFQPYMQEVVPFLARLSNKLSQCVSSSPSPTPPTPSLPSPPHPNFPLEPFHVHPHCPYPCWQQEVPQQHHYRSNLESECFCFNWVMFGTYGDEGGLEDKSTEGSFVPLGKSNFSYVRRERCREL